MEATSAGGEDVAAVSGALVTGSTDEEAEVTSSAGFFEPYPQSENALLDEADPRVRAGVATFALSPDVTIFPPERPFLDVPNFRVFPRTDCRLLDEACRAEK